MPRLLPMLVKPAQLTQHRAEVSGHPTTDTASQSASKTNDINTEQVNVDLVFSVDASGQANISGRVQAQVYIVCQRCMQPMPWGIDEAVSLAIVRSEQQVDQIPSCYEPLIVTEDAVSLLELVEDELLLAMPAVALHEVDQCAAQPLDDTIQHDELKKRGQPASVKPQQNVKRENPFAVLEQLRSNNKNKVK